MKVFDKPRDFSRLKVAPSTSWWLCPDSEFSQRAQAEQARMQGPGTAYEKLEKKPVDADADEA